jgi:hypothetical protein
MRQTISGLVAAIAVVTASAVPAMACGGGGLFQSSCSPCGETYRPCAQPQVYVAPVEQGCNTGCGGWAHERLPDPVQQYYYVNQGPTYTGPGNFAPYPTYREGSVSGWGGYRHHRHHYGYDGGVIYSYHAHHPHFRPWRAHTGYFHGPRYSLPPHQFYAPHHLRYGYPMGLSHHYGYREHVLRRYY